MRAVVIAFVLFGVGGAYWFSQSHECSVGVVGHAATITVRGFPLERAAALAEWPDDVCNRTASQNTSGNMQLFVLTSEPVGRTVCEYTIQGRRWIVRDQGTLDSYGSAFCTIIGKMGSGP